MTLYSFMPKLKPLPIITRGGAWWRRAYLWLFKARRWMIAEDYHFEFLGYVFVIPKGYVTDFASVPRIFWPFLSPTGILMIPALFHDFYYQNHYYLMYKEDGKLNERILKLFPEHGKRFGDGMFRKMAKFVNGMIVPNLVAYIALDMFGFVAWRKARRTPPQDKWI